MYLLNMIDYHLSAPDKAKPLSFKNCSFSFFLSATHGDSQAGQTLLVHSAAGGEGKLQIMFSFLP